jgi:two-component system OmpR family response regulator
VDTADNGDDALAQAIRNDYDAVVLDVMLPGLDGFTVCESMRRNDRWAPVLMLTARDQVRDRIRGLDAGADDYLVKPFEFGELVARLRALTRRRQTERPAVIEVGELSLNPAKRRVTLAGREIELTVREFALLQFLALHAGEVVSREELLEHVWDTSEDGSTNVVDVYVGYLRNKLERPVDRKLIRTVRGIGFVLEAPVP